MLYGHQGYQDLEGLPGQVTPEATWQIMQDLEEQVIREESRCQSDFLSACQAALHASPAELKGMLVASYQILLGQAPMSHPFTLLQRTSQEEEQPAPTAPPTPVPKQSPRPKKVASFPRSCGQHASGQNHIQDSPGRALQLQKVRGPTLE